jgi:hypothetical protein
MLKFLPIYLAGRLVLAATLLMRCSG